MFKWFQNLFNKNKGELNMSTQQVKIGYNGALEVTKEVTKVEKKVITVGTLVVDRKTGERLEYVGRVTSKSFSCPFVFVAVDADPSDGNSRRHSAEYVQKYLA